MTDEILKFGFRLGDKSVYPASGEIRGTSGTSRVQPRAMDVLLELAQQQGAVVGRALLRERIWGGSTASDDALTHCISELRHHLGDDSLHPRFIKTIPKRGYQLVAHVQSLDAPDAVEASEDASAFEVLLNNLRRRRVLRVVGAYAIVVWVLLQVADTVFPPIGVPDWVMTIAVWAAALGFPVVAFLSWTLQVTEKGIVADDASVHIKERVGSNYGRIIDFAIIAVLGLIIGFLVYDRVVEESPVRVLMTEHGEFALPHLDPEAIDPNSIAVLPFANLSSDSRMDYLATGLAEEVLNLLANIRELKVPSRSSSFAYQGKDIDLANIARLLRVRNVLEGNIQGQVEDLRISAQLTDAHLGYHVWSQSFARRNSDILGVRDEIAQAVVDSLKIALSLESQNRILARPTNSADAYDYYLQALGYLRRPRSQQSLDNAEALFRRALDLDPEYALAYAGLCSVYLGKYRLDYRTDHIEPAELACGNALAIDPDLAEAHMALGSLYRHTGQNELAELEFQRAIVMNPKLEPAYYGIGRVYMAQDRLNEAEMVFRYAVDLEPGYWGTHLALGNYYLEFGQPAKAIAPFQRVTQLNPDYAMGFNNLGAAYYNSGDFENSEKAYLQSIEIEPTELALSNIGTMYYNTGQFAMASEMYQSAIKLTPNDFTLWGRLAYSNRFIPGREAEAAQHFRTAIKLAEDALAVNPNDAKTLAYVAAYYANVEDHDSADTAIQRARELGPNDPHVYYFSAHVSAAQGLLEDALGALESAIALGYSKDAIVNDPAFAQLQSNERFLALHDQT